jgi:UDP-glucose 4-epimerase
MRVLVTGALGHVGRATVVALRAAGHDVRGFDLDVRRNHRAARHAGIGIVLGDLRDPATLGPAVLDRDAVIHLAAVLPPRSELRPELAWSVNVSGTRNLIGVLEAQCPGVRLVYTSSYSVFGDTQSMPAPVTTRTVPRPIEHYGEQKLLAEQAVRESHLRWTILRLGSVMPVAVDYRAPRSVVRAMFGYPPDNRLECVHRDDVARCLTNAVASEAVIGRTLLVGGGGTCRIRFRDLVGSVLAGWGLDMPPESAFSTGPAAGDWMDTEESRRLLDYQRHSFADCVRASGVLPKPARRVVRVFQPLVHRLMLTQAARGGEVRRKRSQRRQIEDTA